MKKYEFKTGFWERVSTARALNSLTQKELSGLAGVSQRQIAAYENVESFPRPRVLMKLAEALGTTPEWLATGEGESRIKARISPQDTAKKIPVLTNDRVFDYIVSLGKLEDIKQWHPTSLKLSDIAFAVIMMDDAMATSIPIGSIVTFEPCIKAASGDFVLAINPSKPAIFRQYLTGMNAGILSPLDSRYPNDEWNVSSTDLVPAVAIETHLPARERLWDREISKLYDAYEEEDEDEDEDE